MDTSDRSTSEKCSSGVKPIWIDWLWSSPFHLRQVISHPVGKYGDSDRGGIWEVLLEEQWGRDMLPFVSRMVYFICDEAEHYDPLYVKFWFLALLSRQDALQSLIVTQLNRAGREEDARFFSTQYIMYLQTAFFVLFQQSFTKFNARSLCMVLLGNAEYYWKSRDRKAYENILKMVQNQKLEANRLLDIDKEAKQSNKTRDQKNKTRQHANNYTRVCSGLVIKDVESFRRECDRMLK